MCSPGRVRLSWSHVSEPVAAPALTQHGTPAPPRAGMPKQALLAYAGVAGIFAVILGAGLVRSPKTVDALDPAHKRDAKVQEDERPAATPEATGRAEPPRKGPDRPSDPDRPKQPEPGLVPPPEVSVAMPSADAKAAIAKMDQAFIRNEIPQAIAALEELGKIDPAILKDRKVKDRIIDLAQRVMFLKGEEPNQLFGMIANKMGTTGPDILYEMVTTKGGTKAADLAKTLLQNPATLAKGTEPLRIAWELREAPCDQKPALFARASKEGDYRAYNELKILESCRKPTCCLKGHKELEAARDAVKARMR